MAVSRSSWHSAARGRCEGPCECPVRVYRPGRRCGHSQQHVPASAQARLGIARALQATLSCTSPLPCLGLGGQSAAAAAQREPGPRAQLFSHASEHCRSTAQRQVAWCLPQWVSACAPRCMTLDALDLHSAGVLSGGSHADPSAAGVLRVRQARGRAPLSACLLLEYVLGYPVEQPPLPLHRLLRHLQQAQHATCSVAACNVAAYDVQFYHRPCRLQSPRGPLPRGVPLAAAGGRFDRSALRCAARAVP